MTEDMKQWLVKTSCLGCAVSIVAFKRGDVIWDASIYINMLSQHAHLYYNSWRGRIHFAWQALKGNHLEDISLDLPEDIQAFKEAMDEVYLWLKRGDRKQRIKEKSGMFDEQESSGRLIKHKIGCKAPGTHNVPGCCASDCWCRTLVEAAEEMGT